MPRHEFDKGSKYLVQEQGKGVLWLGGARDVRLCRALQAELVQPRRLPDGLLEVYLQGRDKPVRFLIEVATYPEKRVLQQALDDLTLAAAHFREPPELLIVVLRPKGRFRVPRRYERRSQLGWSALAGEWNVVELWERDAEELLAAGDVGVIPWVPLTRFDGPPEELLTRCRKRIEEQAHRDDRANLLAVSQVMAGLRFPQEELLALLGGDQVMNESPVITRLLAKRSQEAIVLSLTARFGKVPPDITKHLQTVVKEKKLNQLVSYAATCPSLEAFRDQLLS